MTLQLKPGTSSSETYLRCTQAAPKVDFDSNQLHKLKNTLLLIGTRESHIEVSSTALPCPRAASGFVRSRQQQGGHCWGIGVWRPVAA